jgi:hypothetical protein
MNDEQMTVSDVLRWICNEALPDTTAVIDEDQYCYGLDVLHAHEIENKDGDCLVKYKYLGAPSRSGPFKGAFRTHLPLKKGHQFRWRWGIAEVVSISKV